MAFLKQDDHENNISRTLPETWLFSEEIWLFRDERLTIKELYGNVMKYAAQRGS